jgi:predicted nucleic acid-binding protein
MFTIDASVYLNALHPTEAGSSESRDFLEQISQYPRPVYSPTLLLVEVAAAIARIFNDTQRGITMSQAIFGLPGQIWIPLDEAQAQVSVKLAAAQRLRGADAVYAAVAQHYGATLVTRDHQQQQRLRPILPVVSPEEALTQLTK